MPAAALQGNEGVYSVNKDPDDPTQNTEVNQYLNAFDIFKQSSHLSSQLNELKMEIRGTDANVLTLGKYFGHLLPEKWLENLS